MISYRFESGQGHLKEKEVAKLSRSRKHTPRSGDKKSKFFKRYANRKIRKLPLEEFYSHKTYKKVFCSYDICDYESVGTTFEEYWKQKIKWWHIWRYKYEPYPSKAQAYKEYYKYFLKK